MLKCSAKDFVEKTFTSGNTTTKFVKVSSLKVSTVWCKCVATFLRSDWWLIHGVSKFVGGLFCRKAFGNTDYLYWVREELQKVCLYEAEHTLPPLCSSITALQATASASSSKDNPGSNIYSF